MKKKAYMAPATDVTFTHLQQIICGSIKTGEGVVNTAGVSVATDEENETPPGEADARINKWDDEDEYDE